MSQTWHAFLTEPRQLETPSTPSAHYHTQPHLPPLRPLQIWRLPRLQSLQVHGRAGPLTAFWSRVPSLAPTLQRLRVADFDGLPPGLVPALGYLTSLRLLELVDLRGEGVCGWGGWAAGPAHGAAQQAGRAVEATAAAWDGVPAAARVHCSACSRLRMYRCRPAQRPCCQRPNRPGTPPRCASPCRRLLPTPPHCASPCRRLLPTRRRPGSRRSWRTRVGRLIGSPVHADGAGCAQRHRSGGGRCHPGACLPPAQPTARCMRAWASKFAGPACAPRRSAQPPSLPFQGASTPAACSCLPQLSAWCHACVLGGLCASLTSPHMPAPPHLPPCRSCCTICPLLPSWRGSAGSAPCITRSTLAGTPPAGCQLATASSACATWRWRSACCRRAGCGSRTPPRWRGC